jgi:Glycosyl hydrolase family 63 C-terminal domain
MSDGRNIPMRVRSLVGLIPLFAVATLDAEAIDRMPGFKRRMMWFIKHRADLCLNIASITRPGQDERVLLSMVQPSRLARVLQIMLDENEFLSPHGIRGISRRHLDHPFVLQADGQQYSVNYEPAESTTNLFGGNSNWRGPVWFPVNYLMIESLQRFHHYFGNELQVEFPTGSGVKMNLGQVACELSRRLSRLFLRDQNGRRPVFGGAEKFQCDPHFRDHILFYEYFHGDNGAGLGASHQTGWTALVAKLLQQSGE